jgi:hypothetical protein
MPKNKRDAVSPKSKREEFLEAIFGSDEEMDDQSADEILASHGIKSSDLVEEFKLCLQAELRRHLHETNEISKPLEAALKAIRDQQHASQPAPVKADSWIDSFLGDGISSSAQPQLQYSFNRQKEGAISANDKKILDELEGELAKE